MCFKNVRQLILYMQGLPCSAWARKDMFSQKSCLFLGFLSITCSWVFSYCGPLKSTHYCQNVKKSPQKCQIVGTFYRGDLEKRLVCRGAQPGMTALHTSYQLVKFYCLTCPPTVKLPLPYITCFLNFCF